jgi:hypothetical protein
MLRRLRVLRIADRDGAPINDASDTLTNIPTTTFGSLELESPVFGGRLYTTVRAAQGAR